MLFVTFCFLFVCDSNILELLNGFAPYLHGRRVWSLAQPGLNVKVKSQRSRSPWTKTLYALSSPPAAMEWNALAANNIMQQQTGPFRRCQGSFRRPVCSLFGKTSLAVVCLLLLLSPPLLVLVLFQHCLLAEFVSFLAE